ncbi:MAG: DUF2029 domain-containing protein [Phycisphaeraceae bacterium]|nr:DUF2029 domain-containing protein [Phycisphaeraceae bacterium]
MTHAAVQQPGPSSVGSPPTLGRSGRDRLWMLLLFTVLVWFAIHGPYIGLTTSPDLRLIYAQSRAWLEGRNPYHHDDLVAVLHDQGVDVSASMSRDYWPAIYPPTMHPLMAPLALTPWPVARAAWVLGKLAVVAWIIALLWRSVGWSIHDRRGRWLVLLTLAFWPLHTGFGTGQLTLTSLTLGLAAADFDRRGRTLAPGLLLGVAVALKPQVAGVVWLCLLIEGRWRACLLSLLVPLLTGTLGAAVLYLNNVPWLADLTRNLADNAVGGSGDPTPVNPLRYQLLNLQWPLHEFISSRRLVSGLVFGFAIAVTLAAALAARRRPDASSSLLLLATLASLSILVVYRRMYDAVMLLPALAAILDGWRRWPRWTACLAALAISAFFTPGSVMWLILADGANLSSSIVDSWWWRGVVLPSQVWLTLLLTLLLLSRLCRPSDAISAQPDNPK